MPNRILRDSITASETLEALSPEAERLWWRILVLCDDFGRCEARPAVLRSRCFALNPDRIAVESVEQWLGELEVEKAVQVYEANGRLYLQVSNFHRYNRMRAKTSKYPAPPEKRQAYFAGDRQHMPSRDDTCHQTTADGDTRCHMSAYTESESESDTSTNATREQDRTAAPPADSPPAGAAREIPWQEFTEQFLEPVQAFWPKGRIGHQISAFDGYKRLRSRGHDPPELVEMCRNYVNHKTESGAKKGHVAVLKNFLTRESEYCTAYLPENQKPLGGGLERAGWTSE